jgi:excisionase family DNA binding protein
VIEDVLGREMPLMALKLHPPAARPPAERLPQFVDIEELARHLGVSVRHIRRLVSERRIPFHKWGRLLRFDVDEVVEWLDTVRTSPDDEETWR